MKGEVRTGGDRARDHGGGEETKPLRVLIVDDEPLARQLLAEHLEALGAELAGECGNGFEAIKAAAEMRPDVLLLDVQMPKLDGFETLELLGDERPAVIFVTAFDEHALRAFEVHAVDYLLKPVARERLAAALERVSPGAEDAPSPDPERAREMRVTARGAGRILVREGADIHVIPARRLDYAEAQDDYVSLVTGERRFRKQQTMNSLEAQLDGQGFVRIHRSYLLNVDRLAKLELYAKDSRLAILRDGSRLPVSRAGYARLRKLL